MVVRPDCADLPYFLRAYFAFKMGLPFGYSKCSRGGGGKPPRCHAVVQHPESEPARSAPGRTENRVRRSAGDGSPSHRPDGCAPPEKRLGLAASFGSYLRALGDGVHSGSARTPLNDNNTDYYPVPLSAGHAAAGRPCTPIRTGTC